jgi:alpha-tubulin suppressor-like RCC1 family protein
MLLALAMFSPRVLLADSPSGRAVGWGGLSFPYVEPGTIFTKVAAGGWHSLALQADGTAVGWGLNKYGEANPPAGLSNVVAIAAGAFHSLALKSDGTVTAWGTDPVSFDPPPDYGQTNVPAGLSNVVAVAAGYYHSLALKNDGTVTAWGRDDLGQTDVPAGLSNVIVIEIGRASCRERVFESV